MAQYPAAGLRSCVADLLRLVDALCGGGGGGGGGDGSADGGGADGGDEQDSSRPFLSASSLAEMMPADGVRGLALWGADATYGEGAETCLCWAHGGCMEGVRTHVWLWPACRVGLVYLQNWEADYSAATAGAARQEIAALTGLSPHRE